MASKKTETNPIQNKFAEASLLVRALDQVADEAETLKVKFKSKKITHQELTSSSIEFFNKIISLRNRSKSSMSTIADIPRITYANKRQSVDRKRKCIDDEEVKEVLSPTPISPTCIQTRSMNKKLKSISYNDKLSNNEDAAATPTDHRKQPNSAITPNNHTPKQSREYILSLPPTPTPPNGKDEFSPNSAVDVIMSYPKGIQGRMINKLCKRKLFPVCSKTIKRRIEKKKRGEPLRGWHDTGREPYATLEDIKCMVNSEEGGHCVGSMEDLREMCKKSYAARKNVSPDYVDPSESTLRNMRALIQTDPNIKPVTSIRSKNMSRWTSEQSLRACASFIITVAASHYLLCKRKYSPSRSSIENATNGAQKMHKIVQSHYGNGISLYEK